MDGKFIQDLLNSRDHLIGKTYMTRVEGENTRLRHYLARLHRKTLCPIQISRNAPIFDSSFASLSKGLKLL